MIMPATMIPCWGVMWLLALAIFCGCKWATLKASKNKNTSWLRKAFYLCAWPGLDADTFLSDETPVRKPSVKEWCLAFIKFALGLILLFSVARQIRTPYWAAWIGMSGIILTLHFGLFHLMSCFWRSLGINARPLMNSPLSSTSISEFWGRRWNTAFRDITHQFLFRPLNRKLGPVKTILLGFLCSGLVHDLVISVPSKSGYGGPTMFFLLQAAAIFAERSKPGRRLGLGKGFRGWLFAMCILALPLTILFHPPFIHMIILPFMQAIGAIHHAF